MSNNYPTALAEQLLAWFDLNGRKNLPWQTPINDYRVWLSEVMLQQTQVDTVIPYFLRFIERFSNVESLASAELDEVLHLWTGLGYYARARNLHKAAQIIVEQHGGKLPSDVEQLIELPGIGRSTACAIASIVFGQATAILDGNVKRVLARIHAVDGWPGKPLIEKEMWLLAQEHMPSTRCADYTQAIMDLGATLCTRSAPQCHHCPLKEQCQAYNLGKTSEYPNKKPKKISPTKHIVMLIVQNENAELLLEQRPAVGIWGGLWSFPEFESIELALEHAVHHFGEAQRTEQWPQVKHVFSHYKLMIQPLYYRCADTSNSICEANQMHWYNFAKPIRIGLAAPVKQLLTQCKTLQDNETNFTLEHS
ncbi:MAG: A/G-specific adenine glycosylase [Alteromonadaceae bacterium]|nr:MAG: A/G-specific adenine glycosylase [Alteromonadaceae bacterium]